MRPRRRDFGNAKRESIHDRVCLRHLLSLNYTTKNSKGESFSSLADHLSVGRWVNAQLTLVTSEGAINVGGILKQRRLHYSSPKTEGS